MAKPLVSFVIPTRYRPALVVRAVTSALAQSYPRVEVIVVVDGQDDATVSALAPLASDRLRVVTLAEPVGGAEARNIGVRQAGGEWIALLDDDDEALPERVTRQLECSGRSRFPFPIVSSRFLAVREHGEEVLPRRIYRGEDVADYLFIRRSLRYGDGLLHTSTLMIPRSLLLEWPFERGLRRHQDWDLVLRLAARPEVGVEMVDQPLARVQMQENRNSVSGGHDWEFSLDWARQRRSVLGRAAYAAFIATECMPRAARGGAARSTQGALLRDCLRSAWFSPRVLLLTAAFYLHARRKSSAVSPDK